jgi:hypothetical protein
MTQHETARAAWLLDGGVLSSARREETRPAAICFTASPRSQQELRLKPTTSGAQNQREQLARVQIVVLIVPLETVAVKSVLGRLIFRPRTQLNKRISRDSLRLVDAHAMEPDQQVWAE